MGTGITSTPRVGSTGRRGEGPTPVVTRFPPRIQSTWRVRSRARSAVPPSQAASTPRRLSWSPRWGWQRLFVGPFSGYRGSPRSSREGTSDWLLPIRHVGVRPRRCRPRPNDQPCHTASKGTPKPRVSVGKTPPSVGIGGVSCRHPRESSCPGPGVGPHRTGRPELGRPRPRRPGQGRPAVGYPVSPR